MAGLYIHIPFCLKRCIYCDFFSTIQIEHKDAYLVALLREMEIKRDSWRNETFETIYFGGGTPSLLQAHELKRIIEAVYRFFSVSEQPEITLEANPDDLSDKYVSLLKRLPVNRISIGIQSFDNSELRLLNRRHTAQQAIDAVMRCKEAGFDNISIDLMYGLPEQTVGSRNVPTWTQQTLNNWSCTIEKAIELEISHISAYHLTYEEDTAIYRMMKNNEIHPVEEEASEAFFRLLIEKLTAAGFVHYEISNFARCSDVYPSGRISLHNSSYWNGTHYLGLGASAHSYDGASRSWNISSLSGYIRAIHEDPEALYETELLDVRARYNDYIITRLRTMWGVSLNELRREFGKDLESYFLKKSEDLKYRKKLKMQGDNVKVSLEGLFISDAIMRELIV